jgi:DNA-binding response OmpR family regulator
MPKRILVVDDDPVMTQLVLLRLQYAGYEVSTAADGEQGLQQAKKVKPDLMVLDLAMPNMHGYEVCKAIRADQALASLKIIVTSGKSYPVDIKAAKHVGADRYLVKPYPMQTLLAAIEELLSPSLG